MDLIGRARSIGAGSSILFRMEIGLLIQPENIDLPAFLLHADAVTDFALGEGPLCRAADAT
jgi:aspartate racemase